MIVSSFKEEGAERRNRGTWIKITGYFRIGRNLLIFWSKCFAQKAMIQSHDARNWQVQQLYDTGIIFIPILWMMKLR